MKTMKKGSMAFWDNKEQLSNPPFRTLLAILHLLLSQRTNSLILTSHLHGPGPTVSSLNGGAEASETRSSS